MTEQELSHVKFILREKEMPMFSDEEIQNYIDASDSFELGLYELLLLKSENTAMNISGLTIEDTSAYFRRLAQSYRPHNTGSLGG